MYEGVYGVVTIPPALGRMHDLRQQNVEDIELVDQSEEFYIHLLEIDCAHRHGCSKSEAKCISVMHCIQHCKRSLAPKAILNVFLPVCATHICTMHSQTRLWLGVLGPQQRLQADGRVEAAKSSA